MLLIPFQYEYMIKAILVSGFIGGVCALLSCFVVLKGWSLLGDALSHAVVPGVAAAYIIGIPFSVGAFISGMLAALTMGFVKNKTRIREDAVIGIVYTTFFALGVLLISLYPSNISLTTIIMGNILGIADRDIVQTLIIEHQCPARAAADSACGYGDCGAANGGQRAGCCNAGNPGSCRLSVDRPLLKDDGTCRTDRNAHRFGRSIYQLLSERLGGRVHCYAAVLFVFGNFILCTASRHTRSTAQCKTLDTSVFCTRDKKVRLWLG